MNIRKWTGIVLAVMLLSTAFTAGAATFTPGDYEAPRGLRRHCKR